MLTQNQQEAKRADFSKFWDILYNGQFIWKYASFEALEIVEFPVFIGIPGYF